MKFVSKVYLSLGLTTRSPLTGALYANFGFKILARLMFSESVTVTYQNLSEHTKQTGCLRQLAPNCEILLHSENDH